MWFDVLCIVYFGLVDIDFCLFCYGYVFVMLKLGWVDLDVLGLYCVVLGVFMVL